MLRSRLHHHVGVFRYAHLAPHAQNIGVCFTPLTLTHLYHQQLSNYADLYLLTTLVPCTLLTHGGVRGRVTVGGATEPCGVSHLPPRALLTPRSTTRSAHYRFTLA